MFQRILSLGSVYLAYSLILKMTTVCPFETSQCHIPEDIIHHSHCHENLKHNVIKQVLCCWYVLKYSM
jgi:hypothetical protein